MADVFSHNQELADHLALISNYQSILGDTYRSKAFSNTSTKIANHPTDILTGGQARKELSGIGDRIQSVIDEFLATGTSKYLQELEAQDPGAKPFIDYFKSFYGIGSVTAVKFYNLGYRTLKDLWFKANLTEAQKKGIEWREHFKLRIPREEMDIINTKIGELLDPYNITYIITGSYRRGEASSGDVDILIEENPQLNMTGLLTLLQPIIADDLTTKDVNVMYRGVIRLSEDDVAHRLDIKFIPPESYPASILHFTGSAKFNILIRGRAKEFGFTLNEYGLFDQDRTPIPINSEEDIFNELHVRYLPPNERTKDISHLDFY